MDFSVVIPAYNETDSVEELLGEILAVLEPLERSFEILFVDDGSTDGTTEKLEKLNAHDDRVRLIRFVRNAGKSAAYAAAFQAVRGDVVITLDADLQDDPAEIPKLLEQIEAGFDVVVGWKMHRFENEPRKTIPSRVFNGLAHRTFGIQLRDSNSGFRALRRRAARSLQLYGGMYRFIPQLAHLKGFRVTECGVVHRKRRYGTTKYGAGRFWTGLLDLLTVRFITRFSKTPLHFLGTMGIAPFALGLLLEIYVLIQKLLGGTFQTHIAAIVIGVLLMTVGFQCIVAGLLAELLSAERGGADYILAEDGKSEKRSGGSGADVGARIG